MHRPLASRQLRSQMAQVPRFSATFLHEDLRPKFPSPLAPICGFDKRAKGAAFFWNESTVTVNNLGGIPGGPNVRCSTDASRASDDSPGGANIPGCPDNMAPCGCGCNCPNGNVLSAGQPHELRFSNGGIYYDGLGESQPIDVVVRNVSGSVYKPWGSNLNGRGGYGPASSVHGFADISMAAGTRTTFAITAEYTDSKDPVDMTGGANPPANLPYLWCAHADSFAGLTASLALAPAELELCIFDIDTGVPFRSGPRSGEAQLVEKFHTCNYIDMFHQGTPSHADPIECRPNALDPISRPRPAPE